MQYFPRMASDTTVPFRNGMDLPNTNTQYIITRIYICILSGGIVNPVLTFR